ncbi:MAG: COR domain-containing protein [Chitinophagales bacterium]
MNKQTKNKLTQLIADGKTKLAIEELLCFGLTEEGKIIVALISADFKELQKQIILGILKTENLDLKQREINYRLLLFISSIENKQEGKTILLPENPLENIHNQSPVQKYIAECYKTRNPYLDLRGYDLSEIPSEVYDMYWIEVLDLSSSNYFENSFRGMFKKRMLDLIWKSEKTNNLREELLKVYFELTQNWTKYIKHNNNISGKNEIAHLDEHITRLSNLRVLILADNQLSELPSFIGQLSKLQFLSVSDNQLSKIPISIGQLNQLQVLSLADNKLAEIPTEIGGLRKLQFLDLPNNLLQKLPTSLSKLQKLQFLDLANNQLKTIPNQITQLVNLHVLTFANNHLTKVPTHIGELKELQVLSLAGNQLKTLPSYFRQLQKLAVLSLASNKLSQIPNCITQLQYLRFLYLANNQLKEIPPRITFLQNLRFLYLAYNELQRFPLEITHLSKLQILDLAHNQIPQIPLEITELKKLSSLALSKNQLRELTQEIVFMPSLQTLYLADNPLQDIPSEIFDKKRVKGKWEKGIWTVAQNVLDAVREHLNSIQTGAQRLFEAKLLILGEGGVGKTSLQYKLINNAFIAGRGTPQSTEGIVIVPHSYEDVWQGKNETFKLNIWDFGGQEVYHATHQFFLTQHSIYLLVWDSRKDVRQSGFDYWLNIIRLRGGKSPVLIVKNVFDKRDTTITQNEWRAAFQNVKEFITVNCSLLPNQASGIDNLWAEIKYHVRKLERMGELWGQNRIAIRQALEIKAEEHPFISFEKYLEICKEIGGIEQEKEARHLSDYLHHLGVILHFQDDDYLNRTVILHPEWSTAAVYKILNDSFLQKRRGLLKYEELASRIWGVDDSKHNWKASYYPQYQYPTLLRLMHRFELCFPIEQAGNREFIVPELLEADEPKNLDKTVFTTFTSHNPILRFVFDYPVFMPKGIITRFMVRLYSFIENQTYWRQGVLLHYPNHDARALVIQNSVKKHIYIRVIGKDRKALLHIIRQHINTVHHTLGEELKFNEQIPCICSTCKNSPDAHFFEYSDLKNYQKEHIPDIRCRVSKDKVFIQSLISDVVPNQASRVRGELGEEVVIIGRDRKSTFRIPPKIFIANAIEDQEHFKDLSNHLNIFTRTEEWQIRSTTDIPIGANKMVELKKQITESNIIILLISADFISSDLYHDVIEPIIEQKYARKTAHILPIYLSDCLCEGLFFEQLQGLPNKNDAPKYVTHWKRPNEVWANIVIEIQKVVEDFS